MLHVVYMTRQDNVIKMYLCWCNKQKKLMAWDGKNGKDGREMGKNNDT